MLNLGKIIINLGWQLKFDTLKRQFVGTWLSLVEHSVRDAGVAGSNPAVPTTYLPEIIVHS